MEVLRKTAEHVWVGACVAYKSGVFIISPHRFLRVLPMVTGFLGFVPSPVL
jgi:hypothetical protein